MKPKPETSEIKLKAAAPDSEYSTFFLQGMLNRMSVSYFKYGAVSDGFPLRMSALDSLRRALDSYVQTGNTEYLIDAANYSMIEFMHPAIAGATFAATDSDRALGRVDSAGNVTFEPNVPSQSFTTSPAE